MSFTNDWSDAVPVDHTKISDIPSKIRNVRIDIEDRLSTFISGFVSGETLKGILKFPFIAQSTPVAIASQVQIYAKADGGKTRLKMVDEDGNDVFIMPCRSGDMIVSSSAVVPPGFTDVSATYDNKFIRISSGTALTSGGSDTHDHGGVTGSHVLTIDEIPAHTHSVTLLSGGSGTGNGGFSNTSTGSTGSAGSGGGHTHTVASANNIPAYIQLKMYQKS
jgi:hypothetical protein